MIAPDLGWDLWTECRGHTQLDRHRALNLWEQLIRVGLCHQSGLAMEVGTFRGGSARLIARLADGSSKQTPQLELHCFDTWCGTPALWTAEEPWFAAEHRYWQCSFEETQALLSDCPNVHLHRGIFPETTRELDPEAEYVFAHFDADLLVVAQKFLSYLWPRLKPGGIIVADDWGRPETPGVVPAFLDFLKDKRFEIQADPCTHFIANIRKPLE